MAAPRHLGFLKVRNFNCWSGSEGQYASSCQMLCRSVKPLSKYRNFIFRMSAAAILDIFKFQTCNGTNSHEGRTASPCQISLKSLKLRQRYGDFSIFQDGGRRHLGFSKFRIFNGWNSLEGRTVKLHPRAKFRQNRYNRGSYITFFRFSQDGFVMRVWGPPTKGIWWSLLLCEICLESMQ